MYRALWIHRGQGKKEILETTKDCGHGEVMYGGLPVVGVMRSCMMYFWISQRILGRKNLKKLQSIMGENGSMGGTVHDGSDKVICHVLSGTAKGPGKKDLGKLQSIMGKKWNCGRHGA